MASLPEIDKSILGNIYTDGTYLELTGGSWHLEDSPFKARSVARILKRHPDLKFATVCEIGCGAGGVLTQLQKLLPDSLTYTGYEISPHAHAISRQFENAACKYILGDAFADHVVYDLVLVMDVIEHVEDCFSFLRQVRRKGRLKLYHIPLDTHASAVLRGTNAWDSAGHLHLFTIETALKTLRHTGHRVFDWMLTDGAVSAPTKHSRTRLINPLRKALSQISPALVARLMGGYSILIFAE